MIYESRFLNGLGNKVMIADFDGSGDIGIVVTDKKSFGADTQVILINMHCNNEIGSSFVYHYDMDERIILDFKQSDSVRALIRQLEEVESVLKKREGLRGQAID